MPDPWSDFDERWRQDDERDRRRRERREEKRRRTRRRRLLATMSIVILAGAGVFFATSGSSSDSSSASAPVTTVPVPVADTVAKTTKTTKTAKSAKPAATKTVTAATVTTPAKPAAPLTPAQQRAADANASVAKFIKKRWFVTQGGKRKRLIALTFDDGPSEFTEQVTKILREHDVPATFFVLGSQVADHKSILRKMHKEGFVIGDHTESHLPLAGQPRSVQAQQIGDVEAQLTKIGLPAPNVFRPPTGVWDRNTRQLLKGKGMLNVLWSVDTEDYQKPGTQKIVDEVLKSSKPGGIVLMHDGGGDRSQTVAALPAIIKGLKARDFTFVTIPQLIHDAPPKKKKPAPFGQGPGL